MIKVSEELLADSVFDLEAYISKEFARRIGAREEESFFNGDGKGKPLGILAAAGAKTIAFGDFKYYWIADRQGRTFKKLSELYAANGQVGFMGTQRVDGKLILPEAIKVLQQKSGSSS